MSDFNQIDVDTLKSLYPLGNLTKDELQLLAQTTQVQHATSNHELVTLGSDDDRALYLLQGEVTVTASDGRSFVINHHSEKAKKPISHLCPHLYTVTSDAPVTYIFVDNRILNNVSQREDLTGEHVENLFLSEDTFADPLFHDIYRDLENDRLALPALPNVIVRLRRLIQEDSDVKRLSMLVQTEPALTALLMKVANSAIFHSMDEITTVHAAINRVGINTLQNFVMGYALRNLFKSKSVFLNKQLQKLWSHSTEVAAVSYVIAKRTGRFDPDHAMLLGLLHDIGMLPIIKYAEMYPHIANDQDSLKDTIRKLHGDIGAIILEKWNFPDEFVQTAKEADEWYRDPAPDADYCDVVLIAQLFSFMGKRLEVDTPPVDKHELPVLTDLPAYHKLGLDDYTAENSIALLQDAREEITEALHLLAM